MSGRHVVALFLLATVVSYGPAAATPVSALTLQSCKATPTVDCVVQAMIRDLEPTFAQADPWTMRAFRAIAAKNPAAIESLLFNEDPEGLAFTPAQALALAGLAGDAIALLRDWQAAEPDGDGESFAYEANVLAKVAEILSEKGAEADVEALLTEASRLLAQVAARGGDETRGDAEPGEETEHQADYPGYTRASMSRAWAALGRLDKVEEVDALARSSGQPGLSCETWIEVAIRMPDRPEPFERVMALLSREGEPYAWLEVARALLQAGDKARAAQVLRGFKASGKTVEPGSTYALARLWAGAGDLDEATAVLGGWQSLAGQEHWGQQQVNELWDLLHALVAAKQPDAALAAAALAIRSSTDDQFRTWIRLSDLFHLAGDAWSMQIASQRAASLIDEPGERQPDRRSSLLWSRLQQRDIRGALALAETAPEPDRLPLLVKIADAGGERGVAEPFPSVARQILAASPDSLTAHAVEAAGRVMRLADDQPGVEKAVGMADTIFARQPTDQPGWPKAIWAITGDRDAAGERLARIATPKDRARASLALAEAMASTDPAGAAALLVEHPPQPEYQLQVVHLVLTLTGQKR